MERNQLIRLVTGAQKGDSAAMDELFAAFYNDVYYFALKTVKDPDTACDITQETFLEIINTIGNLKEPAAFVTWMKQVTYHQCTRYFKKKKDVLVEADEDGNTIFDTLADESEDSIPSEVYEKQEFRDTILGIINELTEEQRSAVMMYYFDELSVGQIAEIQGVSEGTVKSRLNYARKSIKNSVESYEKKHGIKLHSVAFLPLFSMFFTEALMPSAKAAEIRATVSTAAGALGTGAAVAGAAAASATAAEAAVAGGAAAAAGTGIMAKIAALPLVTKIIAGVVAAAIAVGGGAALIDNPTKDHDHSAGCVDENLDCICDVCDITLELRDENADSICDRCGQATCGEFHGGGHLDENSDGICELCGVQFAMVDVPTAPIELKAFELQIEDGILHIVYPDGEADPHVDIYEIHIAELGIVETTENVEFDLRSLNTENAVEVWIEVIGVNQESMMIAGNSINYKCMEIPAVPTVSIVTTGENAVLTIAPVDGATQYEIYINGACRRTISETTFTVSPDLINVGLSEICVRAYNNAGYSDFSNVVTTGKLAEPEYGIEHDNDQNFLSFPGGDVENAQGYVILDHNKNYLATIPLGGSYDFNKIYTEKGTYMCPIYAYADGFMNSKAIYVWVFVGGATGGYGCATTHATPSLSLNGSVLTITMTSTDEGGNEWTHENFDIHINGVRATTISITGTGNSTAYDLSTHGLKDGDVITVKTNCEFEADNDALIATVG